ncbi:uncharacterized protein TNCV_4217951 [Trichonephila clavipes]|nr:uncharacterized protein TNCV_4217951 [Trichonephila clavipes]
MRKDITKSNRKTETFLTGHWIKFLSEKFPVMLSRSRQEHDESGLPRKINALNQLFHVLFPQVPFSELLFQSIAHGQYRLFLFQAISSKSNMDVIGIALHKDHLSLNKWAVGILLIRASDSRPEGLGSMPDVTKYPPSTQGYMRVKSVGLEVLWAESRVQGTGEYFPPLQFHGLIGEVEIGGVAIYRPFGEFHRANSYCHLYVAQG